MNHTLNPIRKQTHYCLTKGSLTMFDKSDLWKRFTHEFEILRTSTCKANLFWDGTHNLGSTLSSSWDYCGFLSSLGTIADADKLISDMRIAPNDRLSIVVTITVKDYYVDTSDATRKGYFDCFYSKQAIYIGDDELFDRIEAFDWNGTSPILEGDWAPWNGPTVETRDILTLDVWSSKAPCTVEEATADVLAVLNGLEEK